MTARSPFVWYTLDGSTWSPVSGLDKGRYTDEYRHIAVPIGWYPHTAWLFRFDELNGILGLRSHRRSGRP